MCKGPQQQVIVSQEPCREGVRSFFTALQLGYADTNIVAEAGSVQIVDVHTLVRRTCAIT